MDKMEYWNRINLEFNNDLFGKNIEFPFLHFTENPYQVFGHINQCKHSFQCGHLSCRCMNDDSPLKHCPFSWYLGGTVVDEYCEWFEQNPYYVNVSSNFWTNRIEATKSILDKNPQFKKFDCNEALKPKNINEYLHKPYYAFFIGMKEIDNEYIAKNHPYIFQFCKDIQLIGIDPEVDYMQSLNTLNMEPKPSLYFYYKDISDDTFTSVRDTISEFMKTHDSAMNTRLKYNKTLLTNEVMNLPRMRNDIKSYQLKDICTDKPLFCVSGGPSVNDHIEYLKENQDKVTIVAVLSILKTLITNGITPDFVTYLDMNEKCERYLDGLTDEDIKDITFVYDICSNHKVVDKLNGKRVIHVSLIDEGHLYHGLITEEENIFRKNGSVAMMAYRISTLFNPSKIYLIGFDLCYRGGNTHADGCAFNTGYEVLEGTNNTKYIRHLQTGITEYVYEKECYDGETTYVSTPFNGYKLDLESMIKTFKIPTYTLGSNTVKKLNCDCVDYPKINLTGSSKCDISDIFPVKIKNKILKLQSERILKDNSFIYSYSYNIYLVLHLLIQDKLRYDKEIHRKLINEINKRKDGLVKLKQMFDKKLEMLLKNQTNMVK